MSRIFGSGIDGGSQGVGVRVVVFVVIMVIEVVLVVIMVVVIFLVAVMIMAAIIVFIMVVGIFVLFAVYLLSWQWFGGSDVCNNVKVLGLWWWSCFCDTSSGVYSGSDGFSGAWSLKMAMVDVAVVVILVAAIILALVLV